MDPLDKNLNGMTSNESTNCTYSQEVVDALKALYARLNASNCYSSLIDEVYRSDMVFEDSFHSIQGIDSFKAYCATLYQNLKFCNFDFHSEWVGEQDAMLTWTISYAHAKLNGGRAIQVDGATHIKFDNRIYFHKDYFDGGALLYEQIPLLGTAIRQLKKRMV